MMLLFSFVIVVVAFTIGYFVGCAVRDNTWRERMEANGIEVREVEA